MNILDSAFNLVLNSNVKLISSILIFAIFVFAGFKKLNGFSGTQAGITAKLGSTLNTQIPDVVSKIITVLVIAIEIIVPLMIIYSITGNSDNTKNNMKKYGLYGMIIFTIIATVLYHNPMQADQRMSFFRNVGIIGAFFLMLKYF